MNRVYELGEAKIITCELHPTLINKLFSDENKATMQSYDIIINNPELNGKHLSFGLFAMYKAF